MRRAKNNKDVHNKRELMQFRQVSDNFVNKNR